MLWFFSNEKNFCQNQGVNLQNNYWFALFLQNELILMKTKQTPPHHTVWGGHKQCLYLPSYMVSHSIQWPTASAWKSLCYFGLREWPLEDPTPDKWSLPHATQAGESSLGCQKISVTTLCLTSGWLPNSQIAISWIIMKSR